MSVWWFKAHSVHLKVFPQSQLPQDCSKCEFPSRIKASSKLSLFVKPETGSILTDTTEKEHILPYSNRSERASNEDCVQGRLRYSDSPQFSKFLPGASLECTNNHIITTYFSHLTWTSYPSTSAPLLSVYPDTLMNPSKQDYNPGLLWFTHEKGLRLISISKPSEGCRGVNRVHVHHWSVVFVELNVILTYQYLEPFSSLSKSKTLISLLICVRQCISYMYWLR